MKNLFFSALMLAGTAIAFTGCNNGAYDADPVTNNSGIPNPMNTGNGGYNLGHIKGKFNGNTKDFSNSHYTDLLGTTLTGAIGSSPTDIQIISMMINPFNGLGVYKNNDVDNAVTIAYASGVGTAQVTYSADPLGHLNVTVAEFLNNQIKGTFDGVLYNISNTADSIVITEGVFLLPKQ